MVCSILYSKKPSCR